MYTFHMQQCSLEDESVVSNTKQILEGETHRFKEEPLFKCNTARHAYERIASNTTPQMERKMEIRNA